MKNLETYCDHFSHLKRAPNKVFPAATRHKAPHKPLLLLAVMDMVARGLIAGRFVSIVGELIELNDLFTGYWRVVMPPGQTSSIAFPFSRMHTEPFWELVPVPGGQITKEAIGNVTTVPQLRQFALGANLDEELFLFMSEPAGRLALTQAVLSANFSDEGRKALMHESGIQQQAYEYSRELEERAHKVKSPEPVLAFSAMARDQGFRRAIVNCYEHRCAMCGIRIVTPEGHTAVQAAHIKPWSKFKDDEIPNGMALCRVCHWAFDEGLMGVDDDYGILISRQMSSARNAAGFLMTLSGRSLIRPRDEVLWPDPERLAWHRKDKRISV
jgi:putative restriction endonuclease